MRICKKKKKGESVKRQKMLSIASNKVWGDNMKEE